MAGSIKGITVEIGGNTTGLSKALNDVNKQSSSLQKELKDVDRLLKLDPNNVVLVKQKQDLLKDSIAQTNEKLNTLKSVQSQVKEQYKNGDIGSDAYRAFQRELEGTKQKLSSLKEEKKNVSVIGAAFSEVKEKAAELHAKLAPITDGLKKVGAAAAKVTGVSVELAAKGLSAYTTAVSGAATAVFGLTVSAGKAADDINTISKQTGLSTEQIQKFQYATDLIDVPLETLTGSMAKLTKNMGTAQKGTGDAAAAFQSLGISITKQDGSLRDNQEVFNEAITALSGMENATQRDALAMQIFGKSAQDLNPLILGGADALALLGDSADSMGLILSQEALDNLNAFNDSIDILKANAAGSGNIIASAFAGSFKGMTDVIGSELPEIATAIAGIFSGENLTEAQENLTTSLTEIVTTAVNGIVKNLPAFLATFNALVESIISGISAGLPKLIQEVLPALINGFTGLVQALVAMLPELLPLLVEGALALFLGLLDGLNEVAPQLMEMLPEIIEKVCDTLIANLPAIIEGGFKLLIGLVTGIANATPTLIQKIVEMIPVIVQALMDNLPALVDAGMQLIIALGAGLIQAIPLMWEAIPQVVGSIVEGLLASLGEIDKACDEMTDSLVNGFIETFSQWGESLSEFFKNLWGSVTQLVSDGWDSISRLVADGWNAVTSFFSETLPGWIASIGEWLDTLPRKLGEAIGKMLGYVLKFGEDTWTWITTELPKFLLEIGTWLAKLPETIGKWLKDSLQRIAKWGGDTVEKAKETGSSFVEKIKEFISGLPEKLGNWLAETLEKAKNWAADLISTAKTEIPKFVNNVINEIGKLPMKVANIGKDMVTGLWNGIKSMGNWIRDKLSDFFGGLIDGAKEVLGIHSPSTVFRDEIGRYLAQGIGIGFADEMDTVTRGMQKALPQSLNVPGVDLPGASGFLQSTAQSPEQVHFTFCFDKTVFADFIAPLVSQKISADVNRTMRGRGYAPV